MPQRMRRNVLADSRALYVAVQDLPRAHARQGPPARVEKENALPLTLLQLGPELAYVQRDGTDSRPANGHDALLAALPEHPHQPLFEHQIAQAERHPFGDAQAGAVCQLEQSAIPEYEFVIQRGCGEQRSDFLDGEHLRERAPLLRCLEALARIAYHDTVRREKAKIGPQRRDVAADGRRG